MAAIKCSICHGNFAPLSIILCFSECLVDDIFQVNGVNLAEVQEGEVTVTNMHSSNGPDFIFHLKFTEIKSGDISLALKLGYDKFSLFALVCFHVVFLASCQAHARLKCVYFPITKVLKNL